MTFKASWDILAKIVTAIVVVGIAAINFSSFFVVVDSEPRIVSVALFFLIIFGTYMFSVQRYVVSDRALVVERLISDVTIPFADIAEVRAVNGDEMRWTIRTFGVGGLFGYFGKFYNSKLGGFTMYATQRKNRILLKLKSGKSVMITPDDIGLLEALKGRV